MTGKMHKDGGLPNASIDDARSRWDWPDPEESEAAWHAFLEITKKPWRSEMPYGPREELYEREDARSAAFFHSAQRGNGTSTFRQNTIGDIIESERQMVLTAPDRYGQFYDNAFAVGVLLWSGIASVHASRDIFVMFASLVKKHYLLSLFSFVRLHQVQGLMNLLQTLEAGAGAAYAIAHNDVADFATADPIGILDPSPELTRRRYRWLDSQYPKGSASLKEIKDSINKLGSHANIVMTGHNFAVEEGRFATPFFDVEDDYIIKADLFRSAGVGLVLLDLFYGINQRESVLTLVDDFRERFSQLAREHKDLRDEVTATERFEATQGTPPNSVKPR